MPKFRYFFAALLLLFLSNSLYSQKIKYKDLFPLLNAKKYEDAEPFLRNYLFKEPDHANANYQMGLIFQSKINDLDILKEVDQLQVLTDSAVLYFKKSKELINEKEIKKKDEFYQAFNRRDLRSGKFGIKLSDVHFDIENRIEDLETRLINVKDLNRYYQNTIDYYTKAMDIFLGLQQQFGGDIIGLYLKANDETFTSLDRIITYADSTGFNFGEYRKVLSDIKVPGYNQLIVVRNIEDFASQGDAKPDFFSDEIVTWNYREWVNSTKETIDLEINPLRTDIRDFQSKLDDLEKRIVEDTTLTTDQIPANTEESITTRISKFDPESFVIPLFEFRILEITHKVESNPVLNKSLNDSLDVDGQITQSIILVARLQDADSLINVLKDSDLKNQADYYQNFVNNYYGGATQLEELINSKGIYIQEELGKWQISLAYWDRRGQWAYYEQDSIPLYAFSDSLRATVETKYETLAVQINDSVLFAAGIIYFPGQKPKAFLASVKPSREVNWVTQLGMTYINTNGNLDSLKVHLVKNDYPYKTIILYATKKTATVSKEILDKQEYYGSIARLDQTGKTQWNKRLQLKGTPVLIEYDELVAETKIYLSNPNNPDEYKYVVVDKSGNVRN